MFLLLATAAQAAFVKGPYLQRVTQESIVVSWQTDGATTGQVDWGPTSSLGNTTASKSGTTFHEVTLTGLTPSAVYTYRVTSGADTSADATFATAPYTDEPFRFVVVGDTRTDTKAHQGVVDQVLATAGHPDLYFNTGDLVESGDDGDQWSDFFDIERDLMAGSPTFPVAGNHDDVEEESYYTEFFALPDDTSGTEAWYSFSFGNSLFLVLDTNDDFTTASEQYAWAEARLAEADADPTIRHKFAFFHHPPYTSGAHGVMDPDEWQAVRDNIVPLMSAYGVDVVFNGHDHHYERSYEELTGGVTYVVTGGGGAPGAPADFVPILGDVVKWLGMSPEETLGEYIEENALVRGILEALGDAEEYEDGWWRAECEVMKHFVLVEVQGTLVTASVYTDGGELFEEWELGTYDGDVVDDDGDSFTENQGDCDDADAGTNPDAADECDGVDNDCDGGDDGCDSGGDDTGPDDSGTGDDTGPDPDGEGDEAEGDVEVEKDGCGCDAAPMSPLGLLAVLPVVLRRRR